MTISPIILPNTVCVEYTSKNQKNLHIYDFTTLLQTASEKSLMLIFWFVKSISYLKKNT